MERYLRATLASLLTLLFVSLLAGAVTAMFVYDLLSILHFQTFWKCLITGIASVAAFLLVAHRVEGNVIL
jgi:hypothetical protein